MKKIFFFFIQFLTTVINGQQNIGIGVSSPQVKLHVLNSFKVGGRNNFLQYDSSGKFIWNNSNLFIPTSQYIMQHSASAEGLFYGNNQLEYRYQDGTPRFYVNSLNGNGFFYGNLGLGNHSPLAPVHMAPVVGSKIIFWGEGANNNFGIDVQPYRLQFHNDRFSSGTYPSSFVFGYGSSANFTENMRIYSNNSVGIGTGNPYGALEVYTFPGVTTARFRGSQYNSELFSAPFENTYIRGGKNNSKLIFNDINKGPVGVGVEPADGDFILDIGGRLLIRSGGTPATTAGTWFTSGTSGVAFAGMENNNYIGFFGPSVGWAFAMNSQNGALKVNGSEGNAGQLLTSNGSNAPASWSSPTKQLYDNTVAINGTGQFSISLNSADTIPGMVYTFSTAGKAKVFLRYNLMVKGLDCVSVFTRADQKHRSFYVTMHISGNIESFPTDNKHTIDCGRYNQVTGTMLSEVGPGTHTINLGAWAFVVGPTACIIGGNSLYTNQMIIQIFNE